WPVYEGMELQVGYDVSSADNRDAPNPLFNGSTCNDKFFDFKHLIVQETLLPPIYSNSCEPLITIPPTINLFQNKRPVMDWAHNAVETRVATFTGTTASWEHIHEAIGGEDFSGAASVGGVWYTGEAYPETYLNTYFHADFAGNWVKNIELTTDNDLVSVNDFFTTPGPVVCMAMNPIDGYIYYVQYPSQVKRFAYSLNENLAPDAVINTDIIYGNSPLIVSFSADNSSDPEGGLLTYEWNIGDGTTTTEKNPTHVFTTSDTEPTVFTVTLSVTDSLGLSSVADTTIFVNNTPPVPTITSISNGDLYTQGVISNYPLTASVVDAEHNIEEINYAWQTFLYHDTHNHPGSVDTNKITTTTISGEGCDGDYYAFRVKLTVTDAIGLSGSTDVWLYPNCTVVPPTALFTTSVSSGIAPLTVNFDASPSVNGGDTIVSYKWAFGDGTSGNGISVSKTYNVVGTYSARLIVKDNYNLRDTMNATIQVNNLSATEWNSYDMIMLSDSPHAYIPDAFDIGLPAYFHFYESADDEGTLFGNSLSVYNPDQHIEGYNKAENIWSFDYLYNAYPYVAKSTVSRGSDENETEAPFPSGVFDLQIFPPANAHNMVVAFKAPVTGNYSVKNISARRVSSIGSKTRFKVQKNGQVISSLLPLYDQKWLNDPDLHDLGTMNAGDEMYFTLNKKDYEFYDATEIAFTIAFTPIVCTTPTGLTASSITSSSAFLSWNNSGASSYTVTYKKVGGTSSVGTVSAGANEEINLTGLLPCATYKWQVKATCPGGSILRSAWGNFVTGGCKEGMPDEQSEMTLYPNPAMVKIHLEFPDEITISSIKISDAAGRIVAEDIFEGIHVTQTHEIDVTHVPPGVYFIKLISRDGSYFAQFAKQ
ncbi:MAG: PKD domain-containing protein, partial [Chitinophagales bacterium]